MTNHQRFMAVVNNDWWELFVYEIHHKQRAIDALDAQKMGRNITYIVYDATDMNAAVRYAQNIYPTHYYGESVLLSNICDAPWARAKRRDPAARDKGQTVAGV
jgi:hypothetical protein